MGSFFPDDFIDQLRDQTNLVEIIGDYVALKKRGQNWVGLCPFHSERTPSFTVTPSKGFFKCFGCGKAGDVYAFLMEHQKLNFAQAVELLAGRLGISVPRGRYKQKEDETREKLFYSNQFAKEYYHSLLVSEDQGRRALEYLKKRGLNEEMIRKFELGWAPAGWESFKEGALGHGIEEDILLQAGLLSRSEAGGTTYDRFRERVIFPINDTQGRTVGFGGRVLDKGEPKYLNSPETPLFHKGEVLFGLDKTKGAISRESSAIVVEGYMDFLSLYANGLETMVAPLGTALTTEQARLLSRYAREAFLLYDADTAGLKATFRGGDELLEAGVAVRVITLPKGMDPDDFIRNEGRQAFGQLARNAADFLDRKIEILSARLNLEVVSEREKAAEKLLESVARCRDKLAKNLYLKKVSEFIGVPETILAERLASIRSQLSFQASRAQRFGRTETTAPGSKKSEYYLLALCVRYPDYIDLTVRHLGENPFCDPGWAAVFKALLSAKEKGARNLVEALYQSLPSGSFSLVGQLQTEDKKLEPPEQVFNSCWRQLKIGRLKKQMDEILVKLADTDDPELVKLQESLNKQKKQLQKELKEFPAFLW
ncbi:MAG TPA: DNA primase [archaeon]|nr:DNA primase [archaeon]